jgi:L-asparaginase
VTDPVPGPDRRPRIAVFAGPNATVLNSQPLVTSDKGRAARGLPARLDSHGRPLRFDVLRPQRLARPVTVYVEAFSAHPLEVDVEGLYGAPDGFLDAAGEIHDTQTSPDDVPVHQIELRPEDGLYPLPYMAVQADGRPWEGDEATPFGPPENARQPFYPDASRVFEEIDRLQPGDDGLAGHLDRLADFEFFRPAPPGGWTRAGEERGRDFFPYRPPHLIRQPSRLALARITNEVQRTLASGRFDGGLWLEGSPYVEETAWWLNLLIDTTRPIAACAAQRPHGAVGNDGDRNIIDAVSYLVSDAWAGDDGRDALGAVVVMDQRIVASRAIQKADARPGGYEVTGGHGGVFGTVTRLGAPRITSRPVHLHTWRSEVRLSLLPERTEGVRGTDHDPAGPIARVAVAVLDGKGGLVPEAIPVVGLVKHGQYIEESDAVDIEQEAAILAWLGRALARHPLAGIVAEGSAPFGSVNESAELALRRTVFSGYPVVKVGRGNADGVAEETYAPFAVAGGNLTATKARLLLMACLLRFGALPPAKDPDAPRPEEVRATQAGLDRFRAVFARH